MRFDGAQIAEATGGVLHGAPGRAGPIETDTRRALDGAWFLALRGERFDGHTFAAVAQAAGAIGGVFCERPEGWGAPWVEVGDTMAALYGLALAARRRLRGPVVGISGCSGKTTTRELIACALAPMGTIHRNRGNDNNHFGVPMTLLAAPEHGAATVVELGSSAPGEMAPLVALTTPDVRLCLNIGPAHLEAMGDLAAVRREEGALVDRAGPRDVVVVSADEPWLSEVRPRGRLLRFGRAADADVRLTAIDVSVDTWSTLATCEVEGRSVLVRLPAPGQHLANNAAAALAVAHALGVDLDDAARAMARYRPVGGRMRREELEDGTVMIDDAYNANPMSVVAALDVAGTSSRPTVFVLGDMLELGDDEDRYHREVLEHAVGMGTRGVVALGPRMARAASGMAGVWVEDGHEAVARRARALLGGPGLVLLKGSRGMEMERVLAAWRPRGGPA